MSADLPSVHARPDSATGTAVQVCNSGLRHMLRADTFRIERFKDELEELGNHFAQRGHKEGCTFIYVLYYLADHKLAPEHENLQASSAA